MSASPTGIAQPVSPNNNLFLQSPLGPICVAGPTGVGKSEFAALLAERMNAEIIGVDAYQIYARLPVLTAQPDAVTRARIPHHLVGTIDPERDFDVQAYCHEVSQIAPALRARAKRPLLVGGTGLYFRALLHGLDPTPPADAALRTRMQTLPLEDLCQWLAQIDPEAPPLLDLKNRRRVERAIEIIVTSGQPLGTYRQSRGPIAASGFLLVRDRAELYQRIDHNVSRLLSQGAIDEVAACSAASRTARQAIGFSEISDLLAGKCTRSACESAIQTRTRQYAKRQLTWFRHQIRLKVLNLTDFKTTEAAVAQAVSTLQERSA